MKWKDTGDMVEKEDKPREEYFDEEQYSPWSERKDLKSAMKPGKIPFLVVLLGAAIVVLIVVLVVLLSGDHNPADVQKIAALEERVLRLEERLDKYTGIDEKVTRIWEQAKSYEKFKDRFDRSEASTSLRMDHLTMSLESIQKQLNESKTAAPVPSSEKTKPAVAPKPESKILYHHVAPGETLYKLSKEYNVSVETLRELNGLSSNNIVPGQKLIIRKEN